MDIEKELMQINEGKRYEFQNKETKTAEKEKKSKQLFWDYFEINSEYISQKIIQI